VCELRHITLPRIDLVWGFSLDCDPPPMTGPFFEKRRPRAPPASPCGAPIHFDGPAGILRASRPNPHQRACEARGISER
jgi:hypothetical protein